MCQVLLTISQFHIDNFTPCGGRRKVTCFMLVIRNFNPLPPCGGRRYVIIRSGGQSQISIHSLRVEGDLKMDDDEMTDDISIHSLRVEGDLWQVQRSRSSTNFNPLPPCGGRQSTCLSCACWRCISIHSLRVEGDLFLTDNRRRFFNSIHSLRVEGDRDGGQSRRDPMAFQSTPSVWRETA